MQLIQCLESLVFGAMVAELRRAVVRPALPHPPATAHHPRADKDAMKVVEVSYMDESKQDEAFAPKV